MIDKDGKKISSKGSSRIQIVATDNLPSHHGDKDDWWIDQLLELQRLSHKETLPVKDANDQGFVTIRHLKSDLQDMAKYCPQFLALVDDHPHEHDSDNSNDNNKKEPQKNPKVIGYTLTVNRRAISECPSLEKLYKVFFEMADTVDWNLDNTTTTTAETMPSLLLRDIPWALGAQVCVAKEYRRQGILQQLYEKQANELFDKHGIQAIVTAVDHANIPSLRAHEKANFQVAGKFPTGGRDNTGWSLIARPTNNGTKTTNKEV